MEQRICIKFCFKIGKTATETYQLLQQAYSEDTMGRTQVFDWFRRIKDGRKKRSKTKVTLLAFFDSEGIVHHEYAPDGQTINKKFYLRSCDVCMNQFTENDQKNGGMAHGSCTMTMHPHTLHILCSSFLPNTAPLSCSSRHTHQISHCVTLSYSQGLRKFWKDTDLRQQRT